MILWIFLLSEAMHDKYIWRWEGAHMYKTLEETCIICMHKNFTILKLFSNFSQKIEFDISYKSSVKKTKIFTICLSAYFA